MLMLFGILLTYRRVAIASGIALFTWRRGVYLLFEKITKRAVSADIQRHFISNSCFSDRTSFYILATWHFLQVCATGCQSTRHSLNSCDEMTVLLNCSAVVSTCRARLRLFTSVSSLSQTVSIHRPYKFVLLQ